MPVDFEFAALREAVRYRAALLREFRPWLRGDVLEVGAGIGQMTAELARLPEISRLVAVEPEAAYCAQMRSVLRGPEILQGVVADVPRGTGWDAIVSINVLEHIEQDTEELATYAKLLAPRRGALCLFVPARPEIYAPIDRDFRHHRRYTRKALAAKLGQAGFAPLRCHYFNFVGYFAWWFSFRLLGRRLFSPANVRWFDRFLFPLDYWVERHLAPPPFGQSLIAVARPTVSAVPPAGCTPQPQI